MHLLLLLSDAVPVLVLPRRMLKLEHARLVQQPLHLGMLQPLRRRRPVFSRVPTLRILRRVQALPAAAVRQRGRGSS